MKVTPHTPTIHELHSPSLLCDSKLFFDSSLILAIYKKSLKILNQKINFIDNINIFYHKLCLTNSNTVKTSSSREILSFNNVYPLKIPLSPLQSTREFVRTEFLPQKVHSKVYLLIKRKLIKYLP
jgi:hypothetical protein